MEADRYQKNHKLYIVGIVSMVFGLALLAFTLYMLPNLLFGWRYENPEFIMFWKEWVQSQYNYNSPAAARLIFFFFLSIALIFIIIAYFSSNRIDSEIFSEESLDNNKVVERKNKKINREALDLGLKILFIIIAIFVVSALFQWAIYV